MASPTDAGAANDDSKRNKPLDDIDKRCRTLAKLDVGETQKIASELLGISKDYYKDVRTQVRWSFWAALTSSYVGVTVFFWIAMTGKTEKTLLTVASLIPEVVSGVVFFLYFRTMRQFGYFHVCLERMNRFLIANSIAENITHPKKDEVRAGLVDVMGHASMLPIEGMPYPQVKPTSEEAPTRSN